MSPDDFLQHTDYVWLTAGVILMAIEAFGFPGTGLLFAGLGAVVAGGLVYFEFVGREAYVTQFIIFFAATAVWTCLLWKPMKKFRVSNRHHTEYKNIIGDTAYVGSNGITKRAGGEVTWSGTIMKAQLAKQAPVEHLEAGSQVTIVEVSGATLIVKPKE